MHAKNPEHHLANPVRHQHTQRQRSQHRTHQHHHTHRKLPPALPSALTRSTKNAKRRTAPSSPETHLPQLQSSWDSVTQQDSPPSGTPERPGTKRGLGYCLNSAKTVPSETSRGHRDPPPLPPTPAIAQLTRAIAQRQPELSHSTNLTRVILTIGPSTPPHRP